MPLPSSFWLYLTAMGSVFGLKWRDESLMDVLAVLLAFVMLAVLVGGLVLLLTWGLLQLWHL